MSYIYLINLYEEIEKRLHQIDSLSTDKSETPPYQQGRSDILKEFKIYLADNMNSKLPKRIRKRLTEKQ